MAIRLGLHALLLCPFVPGCQPSSPAPVVEVTLRPREDVVIYRVQPGDSLHLIAYRHSLDHLALAVANGIGSPYVIRPGQELRLTEAPVPRKARTSTRTRSKARTQTPPRTQTRGRSFVASDTQWTPPVRVRPVKPFGNGNIGNDYDVPKGRSVRSASSGSVVYAGPGLGGYLHLVIVKVNDRFLAAYGLNVEPAVLEGERVSAGQVIAEMRANRPALRRFHFEIRDAGRPVDPNPLLGSS